MRVRRQRKPADASDTAPATPGARASTAQPRPCQAAPDFTAVAERTVNGVTNISSLQPTLDARRSPTTRSSATSSATGRSPAAERRRSKPRLRRHRLGRRLRPHQHPRPRRPNADESRSRSPTSASCRRRVIGADPATDIALLKIDGTEPAGDPVGRLEAAEGRRVGARDRQPVSSSARRSRSAS